MYAPTMLKYAWAAGILTHLKKDMEKYIEHYGRKQKRQRSSSSE